MKGEEDKDEFKNKDKISVNWTIEEVIDFLKNKLLIKKFKVIIKVKRRTNRSFESLFKRRL